jgi:Restriction endonuclease
MDLEAALEQFDAVEANLRRIETVWDEMQSLLPGPGPSFNISSPEMRRYEELNRAFQSIATGLPPIGNYRFAGLPLDMDAIAGARFEAFENDDFETNLAVQRRIEEPAREIVEYRFRLQQTRRHLVRDQLTGFVSDIDQLLAAMVQDVEPDGEKVVDGRWPVLLEKLEQVERLVGGQVPRKARWGDLHRHIRFGEGHDLHDIHTDDWPSVRAEIMANLYSELEAIPILTENLASLASSKPTGRVTTKLKWAAIEADDFERLLFNILADASDYKNPQWLTHTNAPDRGRDISAERVDVDSLSGTRSRRVIVQAKHWLRKSVALDDVTGTLTQVSLWEPPAVHTVIIATSGRFTTDAVDWIERHNQAAKHPRVEMWPDSHIELLLASRPHLVAEFPLR